MLLGITANWLLALICPTNNKRKINLQTYSIQSVFYRWTLKIKHISYYSPLQCFRRQLRFATKLSLGLRHTECSFSWVSGEKLGDIWAFELFLSGSQSKMQPLEKVKQKTLSSWLDTCLTGYSLLSWVLDTQLCFMNYSKVGTYPILVKGHLPVTQYWYKSCVYKKI